VPREDIDALLVHVELDAVDGPRLLDSQELTVEVGVAHAPTVALSRDRSAVTLASTETHPFPGCARAGLSGFRRCRVTALLSTVCSVPNESPMQRRGLATLRLGGVSVPVPARPQLRATLV
jgi:hypothetical protein